MSGFIHLHCHSEYAIKDSTIAIDKLIHQAKKLGFESLALTDPNNCFATIKFYQKCIANGIKPIFGAELTIENKAGLIYQIVCLCQTHKGYQNLCALISKGYLEHQQLNQIVLPQDLLAQYHQDLIIISLMKSGDIAQYLIQNDLQHCQDQVDFWQSHFASRYYLGVEKISNPNEQTILNLLHQFSGKQQLPLVATNAVQFLSQSDYQAHEVRVCVADGDLLDDPRRQQKYTVEQYLKSAQQMNELFFNMPEALENSVQIAKRCNVEFSLYEKNYLPNFPVPKGLSMAQFFTKEAQNGLKNRTQDIQVDKKVYQTRLDYEIKIIIKMDFTGYFLIVADFIAYAKSNHIPVGPGRGSGAGSLVAYALGITNVDPIKHDLLFERFLNPERISMPDFDIDFCTNGRDKVITYVAQKYGQEKVSQIATHGTMAAKGVVRDVGRVLGHPYGFGDRLSKMIPNDLKITLSRALGRFDEKDKKEDKEKWFSSDLLAKYEADESVHNAIDLSLELEGLARNVGTHAGGVVIAPSQINDFCPIYKGASQTDSIVSGFDMGDLEAIGLVKFDFLGLSNLTVIDKTLTTLAKQTKKQIDIDDLPLDDSKVYQLLQAGNTTGIFQLESQGMRKYLKDLKPDSFSDIVAMLALYRPGPLESGMVEDYIAVKHGKKISYPHPMLEEVLKPTNGGFLYQEQVMKAAQVMAGYSLGSADILRRAMGKKKPEEMKKQRSVFVSGAVKQGVDETQAHDIFDLIDKFSGYGFNKSHSVAYALISYQTAYLKAHYPAFFMASVLSGMMDNSDRVAMTITEVRRMNINIIAPSINLSYYEFSVKDNAIVYGLGAIKGVGKGMVEKVTQIRQQSHFSDLVDFCCRIDKTLLNRRALEALILAGAFDKMSNNRYELINTFPYAVKYGEQYQKEKNSGQSGLFGDEITHISYTDIIIQSPVWPPLRQLYEEKRVMGYFFSANPIDYYQNLGKQLNLFSMSQTKKHQKHTVRLFGLVSDLRFQDSKHGRQALFDFSDAYETIFVVFNLQEGQMVSIKNDEVIYLSGVLNQSYNQESWRINADDAVLLDNYQYQRISRITLSLNQQHKTIFSKLQQLLTQHTGQIPLDICYQTDQAQGILKAGNFQPSQALSEGLNDLLKKDFIQVDYTH